MPTLLVIDRDDLFLPRGWVSALLPDQVAPSEFERQSGLWKMVEVPKLPALKKWGGEAMPSLAATGFLVHEAEIIELPAPAEFLRARESVLRSSLQKLPAPLFLDRSHSTVWDYGPGRTFSTPQSAFDALVLSVGSAPFTETHILRGYSGTYGPGPSGYVLYLTTVSPSARFPLVLDLAENQSVILDDENGNAGLVGNGVSHVRCRGLKFQRCGVAIAPTEDEAVADWWVERCVADGTAGNLAVGVSVMRADELRVLDCDFQECIFHGVGGLAGFPDDYSTRVEILGCRMRAGAQGLWNHAPVSYLLAHNTICASSYGLRHEGEFPLILLGLLNNVFTGTGQNFTCLAVAGEGTEVRVLHSDGNCFHPGPNGQVALLGQTALDLAGWREFFGQDTHSQETDPELDSDLIPLPGSPCLGAGVGLDETGFSGKRRASSLDVGFEQITPCSVPTAQPRREPEIVRRR